MELLTGKSLHTRVIRDAVLQAERYVWIATANLKDMHIEMARGRYRPILEQFEEMAKGGVTFRMIHGELPSRPMRTTLEHLPRLLGGALEMQICPRSHWKIVIVDGATAYLGSANFTGAGLGARGEHRRNLEIGVLFDEKEEVGQVQRLFDEFWMGRHCPGCGFLKRCPDPIAPAGASG